MYDYFPFKILSLFKTIIKKDGFFKGFSNKFFMLTGWFLSDNRKVAVFQDICTTFYQKKFQIKRK